MLFGNIALVTCKTDFGTKMPGTKKSATDLGAIIDGIVSWVEIESPTSDVAAVNRMTDRVAADVRDLPIEVERIPGSPQCADMLLLRTRRDGSGVLILSHIDTVHPIGTLQTSPCRREGDKLYGPGIYDMKGGAYLALDAFRRVVQAGSARLPITFLFTSDEEIGSPYSRQRIESEARRARFVLVTEPARDGGKVVTSRKGVGRFEAVATGVPAHSGSRHRDGRSAIDEMARQVLAIAAMTDYGRGVTTNVGKISGGTAPNVVAERCSITIDLRVPDESTGKEMEAKILRLRSTNPDIKLKVVGGMNRPPFSKTPASEKLFRHARKMAAEIGFELAEAATTGGGSDGNFTAALGVPTLDGLGIDGDGAHTGWEHALISSIVPRTLLMQRLLETLE
jgi:glutamate carboxypeptidase